MGSVCVCVIYYKMLAHMIMEAENLEVERVGKTFF